MQHVKNTISDMFSLEVHIMDQCNLNCRNCTHFCPLVPRDATPRDLNRIMLDLIRLNAVHCTPTEFKILGGEPLMHPQLVDFLEYFRGVLPTSKIYIWTNGLLLPKMGYEFFERCRRFDIGIRITPYKISRENQRIKEIVNQYLFVEFDGWFNDTFWASPLAVRTESMLDNYLKCRIKTGRCNILEDGKIYQCALPAFAHYLNDKLAEGGSSVRYEVDRNDYISIDEIQDERSIIDRLYQPTPFCRYCSAECGKGIPWTQSDGDPLDWIDQDQK